MLKGTLILTYNEKIENPDLDVNAENYCIIWAVSSVSGFKPCQKDNTCRTNLESIFYDQQPQICRLIQIFHKNY